jgi:hypothetical protein
MEEKRRAHIQEIVDASMLTEQERVDGRVYVTDGAASNVWRQEQTCRTGGYAISLICARIIITELVIQNDLKNLRAQLTKLNTSNRFWYADFDSWITIKLPPIIISLCNWFYCAPISIFQYTLVCIFPMVIRKIS